MNRYLWWIYSIFLVAFVQINNNLDYDNLDYNNWQIRKTENRWLHFTGEDMPIIILKRIEYKIDIFGIGISAWL